jgi:hypothetical protein
MASISVPYSDFVAGTSIVSQQVDDNNAAIVNYINARNAGTTSWDAVSSAGAFTSALTTNQIILGTTRTVTITAPTPASSSRTHTIPDVSADSSFVMLAGAQTVTGAKTFASSALLLQEAGSTDVATVAVATLAASRIYTVPDAGADTSFVMAAGTQTVGGAKTFSSDTVFSADVYTTTFTDYSSTSTVTGWTSFTTKKIYYKKIGKLIFATFELSGTSNATTTSFTLPTACNTSAGVQIINLAKDNGGTPVAGTAFMDPNTSTLVCLPTVGGSSSGWTSSGAKQVVGQVFYQTT